MKKGFAYFSAGTYKHSTLGTQPWLNVEEMIPEKLLATLRSHGWLDRYEENYKRFIETAEVGDIITLNDLLGKPMVAIVRLRSQPHWEDESECDAITVKAVG